MKGQMCLINLTDLLVSTLNNHATIHNMRRDYLENYIKRYLLHALSQPLEVVLANAAADPEGELAGFQKLALSLRVPPVMEGCCVSCGELLADFGFEDGPAEWCCSHRPLNTVNRVTHHEQRRRREACRENARFFKCDL